MRGVIVIAAASLGLAGCSSLSSMTDSLKPAPTPVTLQLDSEPPGADARTSLGPSCKTPCSLPVMPESNFSVSFTLDKFMPATVPVQVTRTGGEFLTAATTTIDPNPVVAELQPARPPARPVRKMVKKRRPASAASASPAAGQADTPAPATR
jgi:hypothetical protein